MNCYNHVQIIPAQDITNAQEAKSILYMANRAAMVEGIGMQQFAT